MNELVYGIVIFSLILIGLLFLPLGKKIQWQRNYRQQQNVQLYQQQMATVTEESLKLELTERLLLDEKYLSELSSQPVLTQDKQVFSHAKLKFILAFFILIVSLAWYFSLGRYQTVQQAEQIFLEQKHKLAVDASKGNRTDQLTNLQNHLRKNPNEASLWIELGQVYLANNEFDNAFIAFSNAEKLQGSQPAILGLAATALYFQSNEQITPKVQQLLDYTLQQDPNETASLSLLAAHALAQQDYAQALALWQKVLDSDKPQIDRRAIIQQIKNIEMLQGQK